MTAGPHTRPAAAEPVGRLTGWVLTGDDADHSARWRPGERLHHLFALFPDARVHLYGKAERPDRKVGHVTFLGDDMTTVRARAALAAEWLSSATWSDGWSEHLGEAAAHA